MTPACWYKLQQKSFHMDQFVFRQTQREKFVAQLLSIATKRVHVAILLSVRDKRPPSLLLILLLSLTEDPERPIFLVQPHRRTLEQTHGTYTRTSGTREKRKPDQNRDKTHFHTVSNSSSRRCMWCEFDQKHWLFSVGEGIHVSDVKNT